MIDIETVKQGEKDNVEEMPGPPVPKFLSNTCLLEGIVFQTASSKPAYYKRV